MLHTRSITSRIISLHVVAVGLTALFMPLALYWRLSSVATDLRHRALREHAQEIARYLSWHQQGWTFGLPEALQELYGTSYGRYAYAVLDENGKVLFAPGRDKHSLLAPVASASFATVQRGKAVLDIAAIPMEVDGHRVTVQVAEDLEHRDVLIDDIVADFFHRVGWITLPILLILLIIDIAIFRRALRPLRLASEIAENIGPARPGLRLPTDEIPQEVRPLVAAVNQGLDRLEEAFRVQRDFTADAAHELRTPLSVLRTRLDLLKDRDAIKALRRDVDGMAHVVSQLLEIAELDSFVVDPQERADLSSVAAEIAEFVAPLALAQGKDIALSGAAEPVWVKGNREMLGRALRNLAENAINHTAAGSTVEFVVESGGAVSVLDSGPGISDEERNLIFQRFWRRDRRKAGSSGLGLSIVQRVAELYSATVTVENRKPTGARFSLRFVPASP